MNRRVTPRVVPTAPVTVHDDMVPVDLMPLAPPRTRSVPAIAAIALTLVLLVWVFGTISVGLIDGMPLRPTPAAHGSGSLLPPPSTANRGNDERGVLASGAFSIPNQGRLALMPSVGIARGIAPRDAPTTSEAAVARRSATTNGERRPTTPGRAGSQPGVTPGRDPGLERGGAR